jgi:hypothetical protein
LLGRLAPVDISWVPKETFQRPDAFARLSWPAIDLRGELYRSPELLQTLIQHILEDGKDPADRVAAAVHRIADPDVYRTFLEAILLMRPQLFNAFGNGRYLVDILENGEDTRVRPRVIHMLAGGTGAIPLGSRSLQILREIIDDINNADNLIKQDAQAVLDRAAPPVRALLYSPEPRRPHELAALRAG